MKKSGGIRLIAVGYTWPHIAAKCVNAFAISSLGDYFAPIQLGVGISDGCKAAVHAARQFIKIMSSDYVVAKLNSLMHSTTCTEMSCYSQYLTKSPTFTSFVIFVMVSQLSSDMEVRQFCLRREHNRAIP